MAHFLHWLKILTCLSIFSLMQKDRKSTFLIIKISVLKIAKQICLSVIQYDLLSFTASPCEMILTSHSNQYFLQVCAEQKGWWSFSRKNVEFFLENSHIIICMWGKMKIFKNTSFLFQRKIKSHLYLHTSSYVCTYLLSSWHLFQLSELCSLQAI